MTTLTDFNESATDLIAAVEANEAAADHRYAKVMDAMDELIEADAEFDAALAAYASAEADGDDDLICNAVRQLQWAKDRRATALARCNGGAP